MLLEHRRLIQKTPQRRCLDTGIGASCALAATLVVTGMTMPGCYSRVVGAKGLGADQVQVEEPYQQDTQIDEFVYGPGTPRNGSKLKESK